MLKFSIPETKAGSLTLTYREAIKSGDLHTFELTCKNRNPNREKGRHPIFIALHLGRLEMFQMLLDCPVVSLTIRDYKEKRDTLLTSTVEYLLEESSDMGKQMAFLEAVLKKDSENRLINLPNNSGLSPLAIVLRSGHSQTIDYDRLILRLLAVPGIKHGSLHPYNLHNTSDIMTQIQRLSIPIDPNSLEDGASILYNLVNAGDEESIKTLLLFPSLDINILNSRSHKFPISALHRATLDIRCDSGKIIDLLLGDPRINVNIQDRSGRGPLQYAITKKRIPTIRRLFAVKELSINCLLNYPGIRAKFPNLASNLKPSADNTVEIRDFFKTGDVSEITAVLDMGFRPPIHARPYDLLNLANQTEQFWITEKADGIYRSDMPADVYPPFPKETDILMESEYIQSLNLFLVFNVTSPAMVEMDYGERMEWLTTRHEQTAHGIFYHCRMDPTQPYNTSTAFKDDIASLNAFLETARKHNKPCWYPKFVFQLDERNEQFLTFLKVNGLFSANPAIYGGTSNGVFPTDGLIVVREKSQNTLKIKPKCHLTVDLQCIHSIHNTMDFVTREGTLATTMDCESDKNKATYINGKIYRCHWVWSKWRPREIRNDKQLANPDEIVNDITAYHKNPWSIDDIQNLLKMRPYYGGYLKSSFPCLETLVFLQRQTACQELSIKLALRHIKSDASESTSAPLSTNIKNNHWLDLGFGKRKKYIAKAFDEEKMECQWTGIELDPSLVSLTREKYPEGQWIFGDFGKPWTEDASIVDTSVDTFTRTLMYAKREALNNSFTGILSFNTIHFAAETNESWKTLTSEVNNRTHIGSYWIMSLLDADLLGPVIGNSGHFYYLSIDRRTNWIKKIKSDVGKPHSEQGSCVTGMHIIYHYEWIPQKSEEPCISFKKLIKYLEPQWELVMDLSEKVLQQHTCKDESWKKYQKCFKYVLLKRLH